MTLSASFSLTTAEGRNWATSAAIALVAHGLAVAALWPRAEYSASNAGSPVVMVSACPTARPDPIPAAQTFIQFLLSPEMQLLMAEKLAHAPVNRRTEVPASIGRTMPVGENATRLVKPDWKLINEHRAEWDKRWTREIER